MFITESYAKKSAGTIKNAEYSDLLQIQLESQEQFNNIVIASMQEQHIAIMREEGILETIVNTVKAILKWIVDKAKAILDWFKSLFIRVTGSGGVTESYKEFVSRWKLAMDRAKFDGDKLKDMKVSLDKSLHTGDGFAKRIERCAEVITGVEKGTAHLAVAIEKILKIADAKDVKKDAVKDAFDKEMQAAGVKDREAGASKAAQKAYFKSMTGKEMPEDKTISEAVSNYIATGNPEEKEEAKERKLDEAYVKAAWDFIVDQYEDIGKLAKDAEKYAFKSIEAAKATLKDLENLANSDKAVDSQVAEIRSAAALATPVIQSIVSYSSQFSGAAVTNAISTLNEAKGVVSQGVQALEKMTK